MTLSIDDLTERDIAKTIDHSLLRPELDDAFIEDGCRLAADYDVASVCVRPADVTRAVSLLHDTDVAVGTVIGFPHGGQPTETKVFEARQALADGATELDMVIQIGALRSGRDADVEADIPAVVEVAHAAARSSRSSSRTRISATTRRSAPAGCRRPQGRTSSRRPRASRRAARPTRTCG